MQNNFATIFVVLLFFSGMILGISTCISTFLFFPIIHIFRCLCLFRAFVRSIGLLGEFHILPIVCKELLHCRNNKNKQRKERSNNRKNLVHQIVSLCLTFLICLGLMAISNKNGNGNAGKNSYLLQVLSTEEIFAQMEPFGNHILSNVKCSSNLILDVLNVKLIIAQKVDSTNCKSRRQHLHNTCLQGLDSCHQLIHNGLDICRFPIFCDFLRSLVLVEHNSAKCSTTDDKDFLEIFLIFQNLQVNAERLLCSASNIANAKVAFALHCIACKGHNCKGHQVLNVLLCFGSILQNLGIGIVNALTEELLANHSKYPQKNLLVIGILTSETEQISQREKLDIAGNSQRIHIGNNANLGKVNNIGCRNNVVINRIHTVGLSNVPNGIALFHRGNSELDNRQFESCQIIIGSNLLLLPVIHPVLTIHALDSSTNDGTTNALIVQDADVNTQLFRNRFEIDGQRIGRSSGGQSSSRSSASSRIVFVLSHRFFLLSGSRIGTILSHRFFLLSSSRIGTIQCLCVLLFRCCGICVFRPFRVDDTILSICYNLFKVFL